ncbi:hypothetical protein FKM82_023038, partial [Ascaphus truei]
QQLPASGYPQSKFLSCGYHYSTHSLPLGVSPVIDYILLTLIKLECDMDCIHRRDQGRGWMMTSLRAGFGILLLLGLVRTSTSSYYDGVEELDNNFILGCTKEAKQLVDTAYTHTRKM